jgi:hypothetical protein
LRCPLATNAARTAAWLSGFQIWAIGRSSIWQRSAGVVAPRPSTITASAAAAVALAAAHGNQRRPAVCARSSATRAAMVGYRADGRVDRPRVSTRSSQRGPPTTSGRSLTGRLPCTASWSETQNAY